GEKGGREGGSDGEEQHDREADRESRRADRPGHGGLRHQVPLTVPRRVLDLEMSKEQPDDRGDETHDQTDFDDAIDREEERLDPRPLGVQPREDEDERECDDAREDRFADPADAQETVRSLDSICVPRHWRLGLWLLSERLLRGWSGIRLNAVVISHGTSSRAAKALSSTSRLPS